MEYTGEVAAAELGGFVTVLEGDEAVGEAVAPEEETGSGLDELGMEDVELVTGIVDVDEVETLSLEVGVEDVVGGAEEVEGRMELWVLVKAADVVSEGTTTDVEVLALVIVVTEANCPELDEDDEAIASLRLFPFFAALSPTPNPTPNPTPSTTRRRPNSQSAV